MAKESWMGLGPPASRFYFLKPQYLMFESHSRLARFACLDRREQLQNVKLTRRWVLFLFRISQWYQHTGHILLRSCFRDLLVTERTWYCSLLLLCLQRSCKKHSHPQWMQSRCIALVKSSSIEFVQCKVWVSLLVYIYCCGHLCRSLTYV